MQNCYIRSQIGHTLIFGMPVCTWYYISGTFNSFIVRKYLSINGYQLFHIDEERFFLFDISIFISVVSNERFFLLNDDN